MLLARIFPDQPGYNRRTYECPRCEYDQSARGRRSETHRMVAEKIAVRTEAQAAAAIAAVGGGGGHRVARRYWASTKGAFAATKKDLR
jgi:hypothetical protein